MNVNISNGSINFGLGGKITYDNNSGFYFDKLTCNFQAKDPYDVINLQNLNRLVDNEVMYKKVWCATTTKIEQYFQKVVYNGDLLCTSDKFIIDDVIINPGDRILIKNNPQYVGIWIATTFNQNTLTFVRAHDVLFDGFEVYCVNGTNNKNTWWVYNNSTFVLKVQKDVSIDKFITTRNSNLTDAFTINIPQSTVYHISCIAIGIDENFNTISYNINALFKNKPEIKKIGNDKTVITESDLKYTNVDFYSVGNTIVCYIVGLDKIIKWKITYKISDFTF